MAEWLGSGGPMGKRVTDPALRSLSAEAPPPWPEYDEAGLVFSGAAKKEAVPSLTEFTSGAWTLVINLDDVPLGSEGYVSETVLTVIGGRLQSR
jgi:hypothetical protein